MANRPPEIQKVVERLQRNGLVLYICLSERCSTVRRGPPAMLSESNLGLECPWCREPMAHEWERVAFLAPEDPKPEGG